MMGTKKNDDDDFRCAMCSAGRVRPIAKSGRYQRFRTMMLEVPPDMQIPTCDHCGEQWFDEDTILKMEAALDIEYRRALRERAQHAITRLGDHVSQKRVEELLGLSRGYLSHLKSGQRDPSAEMVANLTLLANAPQQRLRELEKLWEAHSTKRR